MKRLSVIYVMLLLAIVSLALADTHTNYYSLHDETVTISFKQSDGKITQEQRMGFLDLFNIDDPEIECNSTEPCPVNDIVALPTINLGDPSTGTFAPAHKKRRFRVFIPEGTTNLKLTLLCVATQNQASVVKFNGIPDCVQCSKSFEDMTFTREDTFAFETFGQKEVYLQNAGGHINIYSFALIPPDATGQNPPWSKGGWLYVNNYYNSDAVAFLKFHIKVNRSAYQNWFQSYAAQVGYDPVTKKYAHPENDTFGLIPKSSYIPPVIGEFDRGKQYCKDHPQECGIVALDMSTLGIKINSLEIESDTGYDRWDIRLKNTGGLTWKLKNITPTLEVK